MTEQMRELLSKARRTKFFVYLASPLTAFLPDVEKDRIEKNADALAILNQRFPDVTFFSPLLHSESWVERGIEPGEGWYLYHARYLKKANFMIVLQLEGWEDSFGIKFEKRLCKENDIFVEHCTMDTVHDKIFPWEDSYIPF